MFDVVVRGGTVVDGSGANRFRADVGVREGRVVALGNLPDAEAQSVLDATGLIVAPGFVDIHSHSDFTLLVDPRAQSALAQGVTTEIVGNCGHGCAPVTDPELVAWNIYGYTPTVEINWTTMAGYLERLDASQPAVNVASLVPNGNLRLAVLGRADRPATPEELREMERLLDAGLEEGAFGFSTGLESPGERAITEGEIAALCRVVERHGGLYATHTRNKETLAVEAVEEATRTSAAVGARLQVSHIIPRRGGAPADALERSLAAVDRAREGGLDVSFDIHTRLFGFTNLSAALPLWVTEGGPEAVASRLRDPVARAAMKRHKSLITSFELGGWDRVNLLDTPHRPDAEGRSVAELTPPGGDAYDVIFDVLLAEIEQIHRPMCLCWSYDEDQLASAVQHPRCMVGSDATTMSLGGQLAGTVFHGAYTWASWLFRRFVQERRLLTLEEVVHKLAAQPAEQVRLPGRGVLQQGAWADIAVFDPGRFRERGTVPKPNQLAEGMVHVVVNGQVALQNGAFTGRRPGKALRRGGT
jgi:N-acyl-D-aspartate/D-glutamate deacylase